MVENLIYDNYYMTDEQLEEMIRKVPKFLLNEHGRLVRNTCERCGCEWGSKEKVDYFICGVCKRMMELYPTTS